MMNSLLTRNGSETARSISAADPHGPLYAALSPGTKEDLLSLGQRRQFASYDVLVRQGDSPREVFLILDGYAKVTAVTKAGRQALLDICGCGGIIGEIALLDGQPHAATATAAGSLIARVIGGDTFRKFIGRNADAAVALAGTIGDKYRSTIERQLAYTDGSVRARLAQVLLELMGQWGQRIPGGTLLAIGLSQAELAGLVGAVERSVHEALTEFRALDLIDVGYRRILVKDPVRLAAIADG